MPLETLFIVDCSETLVLASVAQHLGPTRPSKALIPTDLYVDVTSRIKTAFTALGKNTSYVEERVKEVLEADGNHLNLKSLPLKDAKRFVGLIIARIDKNLKHKPEACRMGRPEKCVNGQCSDNECRLIMRRRNDLTGKKTELTKVDWGCSDA